LPQRGSGTYTVRIRKLSVLDIVIENQYSDAVLGRTGSPNGHLADGIVTHLTLRGLVNYTSARETIAVRPGQLWRPDGTDVAPAVRSRRCTRRHVHRRP
jgi:hypothetical protein